MTSVLSSSYSGTYFDVEVIYLADPTARQVQVNWQAGTLPPVGDLAVVGHANARHQHGLDEAGYSAVTTTLVVKALHDDARADVAFVYTLQPQDGPAVACAFVDTTVAVGRPVQVTGSDGRPVTLTVLLPSPLSRGDGAAPPAPPH